MVPRNKNLKTRLATAAATLLGLSAAKAVTVQDLGTLGGNASFAYDINDHGDIAGMSQDANGEYKTFFVSGGVMMATPLAAYTTTLSLNNHGLVAGGATGTDNLIHPAYYNKIFPALHVLSELEGYAMAVSNENKVVGFYYLASGDRHAFLFDGINFTDISRGRAGFAAAINDSGVIAGNGENGPWRYAMQGSVTYFHPFGNTNKTAIARGINNLGDIVGDGNDNGTPRAFLWSNGVLTAIGTHSVAYDINDSQSVVGSVDVPSTCKSCPPVSHAFEWHNGTLTDLNTLTTNSGWELQVARSVNAAGHIVGYGVKNGETHAFLFKP